MGEAMGGEGDDLELRIAMKNDEDDRSACRCFLAVPVPGHRMKELALTPEM